MTWAFHAVHGNATTFTEWKQQQPDGAWCASQGAPHHHGFNARRKPENASHCPSSRLGHSRKRRRTREFAGCERPWQKLRTKALRRRSPSPAAPKLKGERAAETAGKTRRQRSLSPERAETSAAAPPTFAGKEIGGKFFTTQLNSAMLPTITTARASQTSSLSHEMVA